MLLHLLEKRWWTAHTVILGQKHPVTDALAVVQDAPVAQTSRLGHAGSP